MDQQAHILENKYTQIDLKRKLNRSISFRIAKFQTSTTCSDNLLIFIGWCLIDKYQGQKTSFCNFSNDLRPNFHNKTLYNPSQIYNIQLKAFLKKQVMQLKKSQYTLKRQYSRITLKIKLTLIRMVCRKAIPFDTAIQELGLKKTTALNIIKIYNETGSIPMRKFKKIRKSKREKPSVKKEEEQSIGQPSKEQMSPEVCSDNQIRPSESLAYYPFNLLWADCPIVFYCYY